MWRVALDALWAPSPASTRYLSRVAQQLASKLDSAEADGFAPLTVDPSCEAVRSVHPDWAATPFMYGPLASSLMLPLPTSVSARLVERQRLALEQLSSRLAAAKIDSYYDGAWTALATATLNGDFANACSKIFLRGCPARVEV